jgi:hypothetical protein
MSEAEDSEINSFQSGGAPLLGRLRENPARKRRAGFFILPRKLL